LTRCNYLIIIHPRIYSDLVREILELVESFEEHKVSDLVLHLT